jgi:predicted metal-dependent HD superfamily phosphohydrolase
MLEHWQAAWMAIGATRADAKLCTTLLQCYDQPHRKYHTKQHLDECLVQLALLRDIAEHPSEVEIALWFHDAIYDVYRHDNELRSAEWAQSALTEAGGDAAVAKRIYQLVMATRHQAQAASPDELVLIDVDLSILGAAQTRFDEYEQQVREEYGYVPSPLFRRNRRAVLEGFLRRPRIYSTDRFFDLYEARARDNLRLSIGKLV